MENRDEDINKLGRLFGFDVDEKSPLNLIAFMDFYAGRAWANEGFTESSLIVANLKALALYKNRTAPDDSINLTMYIMISGQALKIEAAIGCFF